MIYIREELPKDVESIYNVNLKAFGESSEARVINALRKSNVLTLSLIAEQNNQIIGHIAFSPVKIESKDGILDAIALGPMAVLPEYQNKGIGSKLIEKCLNILRERGHDKVVVLGHANYYPRFGFVPSIKYGIKCEYDCPVEVFMVKELQDGSFSGVSGTVKYRPEFGIE